MARSGSGSAAPPEGAHHHHVRHSGSEWAADDKKIGREGKREGEIVGGGQFDCSQLTLLPPAQIKL